MRTKTLLLILVLLSIFAAQAQELTVCSYNVRYKNSGDTNAGNGWDTRRTYLINFVNFQQPDLLGVQEAVSAQMTDMANGLKGYAYTGVGRNDGATGGEYSAIFYRKETMVLLDNGDFWLSDTPYTPSKGFPSKGGSTSYYRICSWGKFYHIPTGTVIYHFNTHLDLDETNRQQSYYLIRTKIQEIASTTAPVIVSGDYNAVQTGEAYKLFYNSGFLYDSYVRSKQKFITNGTSPGFNANTYSTVSGEYRRIDHIFVSRAFNIEHYGVLNPCYYSTSGTAEYAEKAYSDHSPVIVKLTIRTPEMKELPTTAPPLVDGAYQISTPEELQAFSYLVDGIAGFTRKPAANAVLLNDIDMAGQTSWAPIGTSAYPYTGTFDGQGHSIQNLLIKTNKSYSGLFGKTSGATIKNVQVGGTITVGEGSGEHGTVGYAANTTLTDVHSALNITISKANTETKHIGGIAGTMATSTKINRCSYTGTLSDAGTNTIGGIVGYADMSANNITNAINYGKVQTRGKETNTGGILGYTNYSGFKISNCANVGTVGGSEAFAGQIIGSQLKAMSTLPKDLYYLDGQTLTAFGSESASTTGATAVNAEQLASGEVCYKLNGDQEEINWFQTLGEDAWPVLFDSHKRVWFYNDLYTNESPDGINEIKDSEFTNLHNDVIYDLSGRELGNRQLHKGIYIQNGKKIIRK